MSSIEQRDDTDSLIVGLYEHFRPVILAHLIRLTGERDTAEDLCQETFLKAFVYWHSNGQPTHCGAWLHRVATNIAYDYLRRRKRVQFLSLDTVAESPDSSATPEEQLAIAAPVRAALAQIPTQYRGPLVLYACDGHSTHDIATTLGCSDLAVRLRVSRGRACFKQVYEN